MDEPTEKKMNPAESFFHQLAGQDKGPNIVHLDHPYARLWNAHPDATHARPAKMLFMKGVPFYVRMDKPSHTDDVIDVETVAVKPVPPYDGVRSRALMNECERHVLLNYASDKSDDWEDNIKRTGWTVSENRLFNKVMKVLQSDRLSRLAYEGTQNEPMLRRLVVNKTASNIRHIFASIGWDMKQLHWLHQILLEHLSPMYLAAYLDVLQTLKYKVPSMMDKLLAGSASKSASSNGETLQQLVKRPWDPVATLLSQHKPKKLPGSPLIVVTPSGPQHNLINNSRRIRFWQSQLAFLGKVLPVILVGNIGTTVGECLQSIVKSVKNKVIELKVSFPNRPIILVGWTVGALIAAQVALAEPVTAVVCLGFPLTGVDGSRGNLDDPLLDTQTPTLFVVGQNANTCSVDDIEDFRERMRAESGLVVVGGADDQLRVSHTKKKLEGMTQMMVDRCILNEIVEYLTIVLTEPNLELPPLMADSEKVPEPKKRKQRKPKETTETAVVKTPKKSGLGRKAAAGQNVTTSPSSPGSSTTDTSSTGSSFGETSGVSTTKKNVTRKRTKAQGDTPKKKPRVQKTPDDPDKKVTRQPGRQKKVALNLPKVNSLEEPGTKEELTSFNLLEPPKNPRSISLNIGSLSSLGQFKQAQALAATAVDEPIGTPKKGPDISPKTSTPTHTTLIGPAQVPKNIPITPITTKTTVTSNAGSEIRKPHLIQMVTMANSNVFPKFITSTGSQLQTVTFKGKNMITSPMATSSGSTMLLNTNNAATTYVKAIISSPTPTTKSPTMLLNASSIDSTKYVISSPKPISGPGGMLQSALLGNKPAAGRKMQVITFLKPAPTAVQDSLTKATSPQLKKIAPASQDSLTKVVSSQLKKIAPKIIVPSVRDMTVAHSNAFISSSPEVMHFSPLDKPASIVMDRDTLSKYPSTTVVSIRGASSNSSVVASAKECKDLPSFTFTSEKSASPFCSNSSKESPVASEIATNEIAHSDSLLQTGFSEEVQKGEYRQELDSSISDTLSHLSAGTQEAILALTQLSAGAQVAVSALAELSAGPQRSPSNMEMT